MTVTAPAPRLTVVTEASPAKLMRKRILSVLAHVALIGASILMLYPLLWMLSASFRPENEIFSGTLIPSEWSLDSFFRMGYASALAWFLLLLVACFTAFSFLTSKYWVHYDD